MGGCSEFIQACTNDGEIPLHRMAHFFNAKQPKQFLRRLFDNTDKMATSVARSMTFSATKSKSFEHVDINSFVPPTISDAKAVMDIDHIVPDTGGACDESIVNTEMPRISREEMKDMPPSILAAHDNLAAHESTLVRLERRMQELELHCEQALDVLRVRVEPLQMTVKQASRNTACCMLPSSRGTSNSNIIEVACDLGTCHSIVPDQPPAHAIEAVDVNSVQERSSSRSSFNFFSSSSRRRDDFVVSRRW